MKKVLVILILFIVFGCKDTDEYSPDQSKLCQAKLNGIEWTGESFFYSNPNKKDTMDLVMNVFNKESILREHLIFFNIPIKLGNYTLKTTNLFNRSYVTGAGYETILSDGDVLGEQYYVNEDSNDNWIEIQNISMDLDKLILSGSFQLQLFIDSTRGKIFETSPDSVTFMNGLFKSKQD